MFSGREEHRSCRRERGGNQRRRDPLEKGFSDREEVNCKKGNYNRKSIFNNGVIISNKKSGYVTSRGATAHP